MKFTCHERRKKIEEPLRTMKQNRMGWRVGRRKKGMLFYVEESAKVR